MGPFGSQVVDAPMMSVPQMRTRNCSGGSFSSTDSSVDIPASPMLTPTSPPAFNDLGALAMLLSAGALKENLNLQESQSKSVGSSRYKTEMCRSFMETGQCKYGDKCQFAHGNHEQRAMPRHPKYKTEWCRTYHTTGLCPYGTRCHFIHNEDPSKLGAIMQAKQQFIAQQAAQEMAKQAAKLQAQQRLIQGQITALVSQVHNQLFTNVAMQNTVNSVMVQQPAHVAAAPQLMNRVAAPVAPQQQQPMLHPTQTTLQTSLPPLVRDSLGSVADTPPVSPPCGSPVFNNSAASSPKSTCDVSPPPGFAPLANEPAKRTPVKSAFDFSTPCSEDSDFLSQVIFDMKNMDLDSSCSVSSGYTPPSSPESFCQSPMDSPRSSRLPIFNRIAGDFS